MWFIHSSAVCPCLADRSCALSLWMGVNWESQEVLLISIYYSGIWYINYDILYTLALALSLSLAYGSWNCAFNGNLYNQFRFPNWDPGSSQLPVFFFCLASGLDNWENFPGGQGGVLVAYQDGELLRGRRRLLQKRNLRTIFTTRVPKTSYSQVVLV